MHTITAMMPRSNTTTQIMPLGAERYRVTLSGKFDPGWTGCFSSQLAARKINILRVEAARKTGRAWDATADLDFLATTIRPDQVDFHMLCSTATAPHANPEPLALTDYQLERTTRNDGSLYLEVTGFDRIGCLSSLLNSFSLFSLFPIEMLVETQGKQIFDRFWLKGLGGTAPSDEALLALQGKMREALTC